MQVIRACGGERESERERSKDIPQLEVPKPTQEQLAWDRWDVDKAIAFHSMSVPVVQGSHLQQYSWPLRNGICEKQEVSTESHSTVLLVRLATEPTQTTSTLLQPI